WIVSKYFGRLNRSKNDNWVFGDRTTGAHLPKFAWTSIRRHQLVRGKSSPDDPTLCDYWSQRRKTRTPPPMDKISLTLAARQKGICPLCGRALIVGAEYEPDSPREWIDWFDAMKKRLHKHHFTYRRNGGSDEIKNLRLVHSECHRQHHAGDGGNKQQIL
ncbi:HNH endonuclease, partial [Streptomyces scopuliridis]|uniref:HNH endonuclease n=1 Tax=Streptomyces scopuliridis TaxID=452529 RepID=UPI00369B5E77